MREFIKLICIVIVAAYFATACQKEIEIDASASNPKIVVEGTIRVGETPTVVLTKTGFLYDPIDVSSLEDSYVHGANVTVSNGTDMTSLSEVCFKNFDFFLTPEIKDSLVNMGIPVYDYSQDQLDSLAQVLIPQQFYEQIPLICVYVIPSNPSFVGEVNKSYDLNIVKDTSVVSARTTIPELFMIDSLTYEYDNTFSGFAQAYVNLTFPVNQALGKYVRFGARRQGEKISYDTPGGSVYSDASFEGTTNLRLPLAAPRKGSNPNGAERLFAKGDTAFLEWNNIDKATYDFIFTIENDGGATPFSSPTKIISNINGGLGIWSGYNTSEYSVYIP